MTYSVIINTLAILLLIGAWVYPYITAAILRAIMIRRLTSDLRAEGFKYRRSFRSALLTRNLSRRYDMIIYDEKRLYAVKLWSSYFAYNHLVVTKKGRLKEERRTRPVFCMNGRDTVYAAGRLYRVPKIRLHKKYAKGREVESVLLIYPSYESIRAENNGGFVSLRTGDELFGKTIYSPSAFAARLKAVRESTVHDDGVAVEN